MLPRYQDVVDALAGGALQPRPREGAAAHGPLHVGGEGRVLVAHLGHDRDDRHRLHALEPDRDRRASCPASSSPPRRSCTAARRSSRSWPCSSGTSTRCTCGTSTAACSPAQMTEHEMEHEHPLELERIRAGKPRRAATPPRSPAAQRVFMPVAGVVGAAAARRALLVRDLRADGDHDPAAEVERGRARGLPGRQVRDRRSRQLRQGPSGCASLRRHGSRDGKRNGRERTASPRGRLDRHRRAALGA